MITLSLILAMASGTALLASGYLFGAKKGRAARAALAADSAQRAGEIAERDRRIARLEEQIADQVRQTQVAEQLLAELRQGLARIGQQQSQGNDPSVLRSEVQKILQPLLRRQDDAAALREMLREMLAPVVERERLGKELSRLEPGSSLGELPRMLDAIAEKGGFASVVLSDDAGLPLASSSNARDVEILAGTASFLLTLADRAHRDGVPRPQAIVVLDESNQQVLHRIFTVDSTRFTLTAVSRGVHVTPVALDAALGKLERVLAKRAA